MLLGLPGEVRTSETCSVITVGQVQLDVTFTKDQWFIGVKWDRERNSYAFITKEGAIDFITKTIKRSKQEADRHSSECNHFFQLMREQEECLKKSKVESRH